MKKNEENYLDKIPKKNENINWTEDKVVTLEIENKGIMNRIFQKLFKKPKITYIHLDNMGSFIWKEIDGEKNVTKIGERVTEYFGDDANPLYERLIKYLEILKSYNFIKY